MTRAEIAVGKPANAHARNFLDVAFDGFFAGLDRHPLDDEGRPRARRNGFDRCGRRQRQEREERERSTRSSAQAIARVITLTFPSAVCAQACATRRPTPGRRAPS